MITKRDGKVLDFVEEFKVASTSTINELFYKNIRVAQRRLKLMVETKDLKRERYHFTDEYVYYYKKTTQQRHDLLLTDFYRELNKIVNIVSFKKEFTKIEGIRPDGVVVYQYRNKNYVAFVEVEISNKGFDTEKYKEMYRNKNYKGILPTFPLIIAITNQKIEKTPFEIIKIDTDLTNLKEVIKC